ncbi:transcription factor HHO5 [Cajanus cajan]|uniref:transcription factor HHO5 n=1 Tax=Cajanus cajan TaxID=3821 RepID=UPI00098DB415|nr:transcription factor HHO5 [Cajanus cajan]
MVLCHLAPHTITTMDLSLDLTLGFVPQPISLFFPTKLDNHQTLATLDAFVQRLEDELTKVQAFKRELPLSMLLLNDAIARLREEKVKCSGMQDQDPPINQEEFPPLENENESTEKKNWMSSAQLWSTHKTKSRIDEEDDGNPVNGDSCVPKTEGSQVPRFNLVTPASEPSHSNSKSVCGDNSGGSSLLRVELQSQPQPPQHMQQNPRKQRRCWSPDLHRRFVDALQQLGGAQVATPKQIRELMQVDGLTNDEVKSHLQKYRLHVRRFPVSSVGQGNNGSWMGQDECGEKSKGNLSVSQTGSPQGPLTPLLLGGSVKGLSSPGRNSVDAEDEQSDCQNWKGGFHHQLEPDNQSL